MYQVLSALPIFGTIPLIVLVRYLRSRSHDFFVILVASLIFGQLILQLGAFGLRRSFIASGAQADVLASAMMAGTTIIVWVAWKLNRKILP
jgi:hypothetical protein